MLIAPGIYTGYGLRCLLLLTNLYLCFVLKGKTAASKKDDDVDDDDEDVAEDEEGPFRRNHSRATFSAVIGLSCGALVIMIIIVVAMAMRRTRPSNNTKTVLVDEDVEGASEKSHLVNMQENGYENPTYRFYDY